MTPLAKRRLAALREFSDLGAGFRIAALDLELRGAGNLLGREQHGHISAVGFDLYCQMLERAVANKKGESRRSELRATLNLGLDIRIPPEYIPGENLRLRTYKRIAGVTSDAEREAVRRELADRFGPPPPAVANLLDYAVLKSLCERLQISSVERRGAEVALKFHPTTPVRPERLVGLVRKQKGMRLDPSGVLTVTLDRGAAERRPRRSETYCFLWKQGAKMPQRELMQRMNNETLAAAEVNRSCGSRPCCLPLGAAAQDKARTRARSSRKSSPASTMKSLRGATSNAPEVAGGRRRTGLPDLHARPDQREGRGSGKGPAARPDRQFSAGAARQGHGINVDTDVVKRLDEIRQRKQHRLDGGSREAGHRERRGLRGFQEQHPQPALHAGGHPPRGRLAGLFWIMRTCRNITTITSRSLCVPNRWSCGRFS